MYFGLTTSRIWKLFYGYYVALIEGRHLLEGDAYFNVDPKGAALIWGPALIRGNTVSGFVFCIWSSRKYTLSSLRTLCSFLNSLLKWNRSLAVAVSFPNSFSLVFSKFVLENFVSTRFKVLSACLNFSVQDRILLVNFLWSCIIKFYKPISTKLSNRNISCLDCRSSMLHQCVPFFNPPVHIWNHKIILRPLLIESSFMVIRVLNFWMRDAVIISLLSTKFTLEVNLLILAFRWNTCTNIRLSLREKCPIRSFLWSVFSCFRTANSVRIQENTDQKKLRIWTLFT